MNAVKCSEVCANGSEDRQCPGHLQRAVQGHGDAGQLTETRNHVLKKQLPSTEGENASRQEGQEKQNNRGAESVAPHVPAKDLMTDSTLK
eukprot:superscaffoldBa00000283_g3484